MKTTKFWASGEGSSSVQEIFASTQVQLTSVDVQALSVTPITLVSGVPGKVIVPIDIYFQNTSISPMETSGAKMLISLLFTTLLWVQLD